MHHLSLDRRSSFRVSIPGTAILGCWLVGSSLGLWAARFHGDTLSELVLRAGASEPSFRDALMAAMLPLLLSAFAVFFFRRFGAYPACFLRGLFLGYFLGVLVDAGGLWLGVLLHFTGIMTSPAVLWYLWRRAEERPDAARDLIHSVLACAAVSAAEYWVVAPFLAAALTF